MKTVELVIDQPVWFSRTIVVELPDGVDPQKSKALCKALADERLIHQVTLDRKSKWKICIPDGDMSMHLGPVEIVSADATDRQADFRIEPRVFRYEWQEEAEDFMEGFSSSKDRRG
ncbi:MAG: hypothetical protein R3C11_24900 [Planctomycetaceae bacterium]